MKENKWIRLLAYITGLVNLELLLQNEYLVAENRILRAHLPSRLRLSDPQRSRMVKKLDLLESNHGCGLNALSRESIPNRT